jgi:hypothetical protein
MKSIDYKVISYESNLPPLSNNLEVKLKTFLMHPRYSTHTTSMITMNRINILNEYLLSYKLMKYGDVIHLKDIKKYAYNFFDENYILTFDKVPCGDEWLDIEKFRLQREKIFNLK